MKRYFILLFLHLVFQATTLDGQGVIQEQMNDWAANPVLAESRIGLVVLDNHTGKVVAGMNEELGFCPASSLKLLTTSAALDILGSTFRYKTALAHTGQIENGVLYGDLWIIGGGDPSLGGDRFEEGDMEDILKKFGREVQALGIKEIKGEVIADGSYFSGVRAGRGWPAQDIGNYYGAGVWGLNINENMFFIDFNLQSAGSRSPKLIDHRPFIPHLTLINELKTGSAKSGDQAYIFGGPYNYKRFIRGSLPAGSGKFTIKGSVPDAPYLAAYHLKKHLESIGIKSLEASTWIDRETKSSAAAKVFYTLESPTLSKLVEATNHESLNLYCEAFLRSVHSKDRSELGGIEKIHSWLAEKEISRSVLRLMDGSGLSPQNRISPLTLAQIVYQGKDNLDFVGSIPQGTVDGTAKYLFRGDPNGRLIRVKSGYITGVRSYTGLAKSITGRSFSFSFMINDYKCSTAQARSLLEELMIFLTSVE